MIDVAIIDDHPIARCGVEHALSARPNVRVTQSIGSPDELDTGASPPDVLLLDLYLNVDKPSLPAVAQLSAWTKVVVMSASGRPRDVVGAIQAGARGYLTKHSSIEMFAQAVETVAAGGFAMSSELADVIHSELGAAQAPVPVTVRRTAVPMPHSCPRVRRKPWPTSPGASRTPRPPPAWASARRPWTPTSNASAGSCSWATRPS